MKKTIIELRDYQLQDKIAIEKAYKEFRSVLYQLPTGGGKGKVVASIIGDHRDENIIVFAHKRRLLKQLKDNLQQIGIKCGILQGQYSENLDANIVIVSIRTAVKEKRLEVLLKRKWDRYVIDEARHSRTGSYDTVLDALVEKYPNIKGLGVDATPYRKDKKRLDKHFQHMVVSCEDVKSLMEKGWLQKPKIVISPIDQESLKERVKEVANDYQMSALSEYMRQPQYIDYVIQQYADYGEQRQALVFAVDKAHAYDLRDAFKEVGCSVDLINSDMSVEEIETAYENYESGETQILINIEMATEGVDLPTTGCIIGARPTKSLTLYMQMVGRGTRADGEFDYFIILDCCGWTEEHGGVSAKRDWSLNPELDPNISRTKNKIVGVNEDGSYVEDLTDFIGEVIEMTPEEYIAKLSHGLENAEKANQTIDEKIEEMQASLLKFFSEVFNAAMGGRFISQIINHYGERQLIFKVKNEINEKKLLEDSSRPWLWTDDSHVRIVLSKSIKEYFAELKGYNDYTIRDREQYMKYTILTGTLNSMFQTDRGILKKAEEIMIDIQNLEKNKINLDLYREAADKHKEDQWVAKAQAHAAAGKTFELPTTLTEKDYFKKASYRDITKITVHGKSIAKYHNKITIELQGGWNNAISTEEKNYVPGEKVWELLKAAKWGEE